MHDAAGFFFSGAGVVPGFLFYSAEPVLALMAMTVLMVAGGLSGMADPEAPLRTVEARRPTDEGR